MQKGVVNIDWMVGVIVFAIFTAMSLVYYTTLFPEKTSPLEDGKTFISEEIFNELSVSTQEITVNYDGAPGVLKFDFNWPLGTKNSTVVLLGGSEMDCEIEGDTIYWNALGPGYYTIRYSDADVNLRCNKQLPPAATTVEPWVGIPEKMFSQAKINEMSSTPYQTFRENLGLVQNFRIHVNMTGSESWYGPQAPPASMIFTAEKSLKLEETGEIIKVRVLMW